MKLKKTLDLWIECDNCHKELLYNLGKKANKKFFCFACYKELLQMKRINK